MEGNVGPLLTGAADFLKSGEGAGWGQSIPSLSQSLPAGCPRVAGNGHTGLPFLDKESRLQWGAFLNAPWKEKKGCRIHLLSHWDSSLGLDVY